jgi:hypothetical protein
MVLQKSYDVHENVAELDSIGPARLPTNVMSRRDNSMKARCAIAVSIVLVASALAFAGEGSWTGYITDSKCGAKAAHEGAEECTAKCVKEGAKLVFVNDTDKKVYAISDQDKVAAHSGHHVAVKGSVEGDTLTVASIDMAHAKGK